MITLETVLFLIKTLTEGKMGWKKWPCETPKVHTIYANTLSLSIIVATYHVRRWNKMNLWGGDCWVWGMVYGEGFEECDGLAVSRDTLRCQHRYTVIICALYRCSCISLGFYLLKNQLLAQSFVSCEITRKFQVSCFVNLQFISNKKNLIVYLFK